MKRRTILFIVLAGLAVATVGTAAVLYWTHRLTKIVAYGGGQIEQTVGPLQYTKLKTDEQVTGQVPEGVPTAPAASDADQKGRVMGSGYARTGGGARGAGGGAVARETAGRGIARGGQGAWFNYTAPGEAGGRQAQPGIPGSLPSPSEELWIIQKPDQPAPPDADRPGCGALMAVLPGQEKEIPLPLKHTDVSTSISAYIATVDVTQQYHNPYDSKIEAVYVFPLPENAAINEFIMTVGERRIRGIIKEREEAERTYAEAKAQGYVASLLTQERPNVFTQKVANIEPGKAIDINIKYFHTLAYVDGWYEYVFPMVVGPRFNPPGSTDGVGSVGRGKNGASGQSTEVQYLKPGERSGHDISLAVKIDAGVAIEDVKSTNHVIAVKKDSPEQVAVKLSDLDAIPNKDFVLRYKVAGQRIKSALLTHQDERGGFFSLLVYPPEDLKSLNRKPLEMVFVLDCSGSMNGQPIAQAKKAVERALRNMQPDDTFQLVRFSVGASQMGTSPVPATPDNVRRGLEYLAALQGEGGTMMIEGIKAALDFPHDPKRLRFVSFLTDGYIGNEAEILREVHGRLGASRIFSFGVGASPNRFLLDGLAKMGNGAVAYVSLNENAGEVMDLFFERISHPAMTDIAVNWGGMQVSDVFPSRMPDLFVGRPVVVTGRFSGEVASNVTVRGETGEKPVDMTVADRPGRRRRDARRSARRVGPDEDRRSGRSIAVHRWNRAARGGQAGGPGVRPDVGVHGVRRGRYAHANRRRPRHDGQRGRACAGGGEVRDGGAGEIAHVEQSAISRQPEEGGAYSGRGLTSPKPWK